MREEMKKLKELFFNISTKGFIRAINNYNSGCGLTFEKLIGKDAENFEIPDFGEIQIKTKVCSNSRFPMTITLFSAAPDGDYLFEIKRLRNKFGIPDKKNPNLLCFNGLVTAKGKAL